MRVNDSATHGCRVAVPGLAWAAVGVVAFSGTFPATAVALRGFDPLAVGAGRSVGAAALAAVALRVARAPRPTRHQLPLLLNVAAGCGIGFGLLSAIALGQVSASHAAVVVGLLPAATAAAAVWRAGERPGRLFWTASLAGAATVAAFALRHGGGGVSAADALLLAALLVAGLGYAEGGRLARTMPGWQVISWAVVLALPVSLPVTAWSLATHPPHLRADAVAGLLYVASVSMFLGFFAWYRGLALAGIARAGQLQLAQPFLSIALSAWLLGERPGADAYLTAAAVLGCVALTQWSHARPHRPHDDAVTAVGRRVEPSIPSAARPLVTP